MELLIARGSVCFALGIDGDFRRLLCHTPSIPGLPLYFTNALRPSLNGKSRTGDEFGAGFRATLRRLSELTFAPCRLQCPLSALGNPEDSIDPVAIEFGYERREKAGWPGPKQGPATPPNVPNG